MTYVSRRFFIRNDGNHCKFVQTTDRWKSIKEVSNGSSRYILYVYLRAISVIHIIHTHRTRIYILHLIYVAIIYVHITNRLNILNTRIAYLICIVDLQRSIPLKATAASRAKSLRRRHRLLFGRVTHGFEAVGPRDQFRAPVEDVAVLFGEAFGAFERMRRRFRPRFDGVLSRAGGQSGTRTPGHL